GPSSGLVRTLPGVGGTFARTQGPGSRDDRGCDRGSSRGVVYVRPCLAQVSAQVSAHLGWGGGAAGYPLRGNIQGEGVQRICSLRLRGSSSSVPSRINQ